MGAEGEVICATKRRKDWRDWISLQYEIAVDPAPCELDLGWVSNITQTDVQQIEN